MGGLKRLSQPTFKESSVQYHARAPDCSPQIEEELNVGGLKRLTPPTFKENSAQYHTFSRFRAEELNVGGSKRLTHGFILSGAIWWRRSGSTFSNINTAQHSTMTYR